MSVNTPQRHLGNWTIHRSVICILAAALAVVMGPAGASVAASPHVLTLYHFFETYNSTVYLTTDGTTPYGAAETGSGPGRDIAVSDTGHRWVDPDVTCGGGGCEVFHLVVGSGYCLAPNNTNQLVEIRDCSNAGVNWAFKGSSPALDGLWINTYWSDAFGSDQFMAGSKDKGLNIFPCGNVGISCFGQYKNWSVSAA
jgi:hypothetical protein